MLAMQIQNGKPPFVDLTPAMLEARAIQTGEHCLACTAGCGSSCTGALQITARAKAIRSTLMRTRACGRPHEHPGPRI